MATDSFPFPTSTTDSGATVEGGLAGGMPLRAAATLPAGNPAAPFGDNRGDLVDRVARTAHATIDRLVDVFEPKLLTVYLHCFNMQLPEGWPALNAKLESDERLVLA